MQNGSWNVVEKFPGFYAKRDVTQLAPGALIVGSRNVRVGDDDRVLPRQGSERLGAATSSTTPGQSLFTFKKRDGSEVMMRSWGTVLEYYHPDKAAWENLNTGYTDGQVFGYASHNTSDDAVDYVYFCNSYEPYSRWNGAYDRVDGTYAGGETSLTIEGSVLTSEILFTGLASSCTTTSITFSSGGWATDLWNGFYVLITDGANVNQISKISATTTTSITFATITGLSGTPTFQIRRLKFDDSDKTLRIGTSDVTYTGFTDYNTLSGVSGMPAAADGDAVCQAVKTYPANPRGNVLRVMNTRMFVAGTRISGTEGGPGSQASLHYSSINDATDFAFSATRTADEGGIIDFPERGGGITNIETNEDVLYVFKSDVTYTVTFTEDGNDLPQRKPLLGANNVGAVGPKAVVKTDSDVFYMSPDGTIRSVRRPEVTDFARPEQLSDNIKKFLEGADVTDAATGYHDALAVFSFRREDSSTNDITLVYDFNKKCWHAPVYGFNASAWTVYGNELYYLSSTNHEVWKVNADRWDDGGLPYEAVARFSYNNYGNPTMPKQYDLLFMDLLLAESTTITITTRYNYLGGSQERTSTLSGTETKYLIANPASNGLGENPLGSQPLGSVLEEEDAPDDLPRFRVYFTTSAADFYELSVEVRSEAAGSQWEVIRFGTDFKVQNTHDNRLNKKLS